jgi:hypothetical protein
MKLPSRRELPDYYEIIKKPLDIKKILQRIDEGKVHILSKQYSLSPMLYYICFNRKSLVG